MKEQCAKVVLDTWGIFRILGCIYGKKQILFICNWSDAGIFKVEQISPFIVWVFIFDLIFARAELARHSLTKTHPENKQTNEQKTKQKTKQTPKDPQPPKTWLLQKSENHLCGILGNVQSALRSKENKIKKDLIGKSLLSLINNDLHNSSKTVQEVTCYTPCPSSLLLLWISQSERILTITAYLQGVSAGASQHLVCYLICDQKVSFQLVILQSGFFYTISAYSATENR